MADDAATELAKNITSNVVPFGIGEAAVSAQNVGLNLLRQLGLLPTPQYQPSLNEPLPYKDPRTGQIVYPPGYNGPKR